jgi:quinolinate synthase
MTTNEIYQKMVARFAGHVPEVELYMKAPIVAEILALKKERNAVILGHNYMEQVLYEMIPDFRGDSLELSRRAAETDKEVIVFCGVRFMAETAKILNPKRTVLLPSLKGGCSLASSITAQDVLDLKRRYPGLPVVSYINTYAEVKAVSDVCCTSGNAAKVVEWAAREFGSDRVIFLPDEYLARNIARETGREMVFPTRGDDLSGDLPPSCRMIGWHGRCEVHEKFTVEDIRLIRKEYPNVFVLAHPECSPEVVFASDFSGSTSAMIRVVSENKDRPILLLTECSMGDNILAANPEAKILRLCRVRCPHMGEITLEEVRDGLMYMRYEINIPEETRVAAEQAVRRMIAIGGK